MNDMCPIIIFIFTIYQKLYFYKYNLFYAECSHKYTGAVFTLTKSMTLTESPATGDFATISMDI